jgi:hypothetical protein
MSTTNRLRKIHLDFHTSPLVPNVGAQFDADVFGNTLAAAHVNYVVCFAKCHHGMSYYNTRAGTRHPTLTFDLLGAQIEACHRRDIAISAYLSVVCDEEAVRLHPEWQQLGPDGTPRNKTPGRGWGTVCLNSPYIEESLMPQVEEVCRQYEVDGMWFDMVYLIDNACYCEWCQRRMRDMRLSYDQPGDRFQYAMASIQAYLSRCSSAIRAIKPHADIEYNDQVRFNARRSLPHITGFEIECTPWARGYFYFGQFCRYVRTLGLPSHGVSPRFHRAWADFGSVKTEAQLRWETATMLANGSGCSIGDQMDPCGRLEPLVYKRIGAAYQDVAACEPWCLGATPVTEIAVLADDDTGGHGAARAPDSIWGVTRMLVETHNQFDIIDRETRDLDRYRLLILPDALEIDAGLAARIQAFIDKGGRLIASHLAGFAQGEGRSLLPGLGVTWAGLTDYTVNFIQWAHPSHPEDEGFRFVVRFPFAQVNPSAGAVTLAHLWHPIFERTPEHYMSHHHAPPGRRSDYPAIVRNGNAIYIAAPIFGAYHLQGDFHCRTLFERCLDELLPDRLVRVGGPSVLEVTLMRQAKRLVVHLVNYAACKRGRAPECVEEIPPLLDVDVSVRAASPARVYLAPSLEELSFARDGDRIRVRVPRIDTHQMIVLES